MGAMGSHERMDYTVLGDAREPRGPPVLACRGRARRWSAAAPMQAIAGCPEFVAEAAAAARGQGQARAGRRSTTSARRRRWSPAPAPAPPPADASPVEGPRSPHRAAGGAAERCGEGQVAEHRDRARRLEPGGAARVGLDGPGEPAQRAPTGRPPERTIAAIAASAPTSQPGAWSRLSRSPCRRRSPTTWSAWQRPPRDRRSRPSAAGCAPRSGRAGPRPPAA